MRIAVAPVETAGPATSVGEPVGSRLPVGESARPGPPGGPPTQPGPSAGGPAESDASSGWSAGPGLSAGGPAESDASSGRPADESVTSDPSGGRSAEPALSPGGPAMSDPSGGRPAGAGPLGGVDPAVLRLALFSRHHNAPLRLEADVLQEAEATLARWRGAVARWARRPSRPVPDDVRGRLRAAWDDDLDVPRVLDVLRGVENEPDLPDGARFETYAYADRLLGLELTRDLGAPS
nr:hypothetical protein [Streptomyces afghaniensis]